MTRLLDQISKMVELGREAIIIRIPESGSIQARLLLRLWLTNLITVTVELIVIVVVKEELMLKHGFEIVGLGKFGV